MAHERHCITCGKQYQYCSNCGQYNPRELWRYLFCSHDCKTLHDTTELLKTNSITIDEAKSRIKGIDLSNRANFHKDINDAIDKINTSYSFKPKKDKKNKHKKYEASEVTKSTEDVTLEEAATTTEELVVEAEVISETNTEDTNSYTSFWNKTED